MGKSDIEAVVIELSEKYGARYSVETVIECLENAIMSAVLIVYRKVSFVVWEGTVPHVYLVNNGGFREIDGFTNYTVSLLTKLFNIYLKRKASLEKIWISGKRHGEVSAGSVREILPNGDLIIDIQGVKGIKGILKKEDQIKKERNKYFEGAKLFFYIKRTADMPDGNVGLSLSRNSKSLVTGLLKLLSSDIIDSFYERKGRMPVVLCYRRIAGTISEVYSEILLSKEVMTRVRILSNDCRLRVKPFSM